MTLDSAETAFAKTPFSWFLTLRDMTEFARRGGKRILSLACPRTVLGGAYGVFPLLRVFHPPLPLSKYGVRIADFK